MDEKRLSRALLLLLGWAVSLLLPVAEIGTGPNSSWPGFAVLFGGWMAMKFGQFGWLANPLLLPALLLLSRRRVPSLWGSLVGAAMVGFALHSFDFDSVQGGHQAGSTTRLGPGYFLWIAVIASTGGLLLLTALQDARSSRTGAIAGA